MDLQLNKKSALVTGARMGIGRAIAMDIAAEGVKPCVAARLRELLEQLSVGITNTTGFQLSKKNPAMPIQH